MTSYRISWNTSYNGFHTDRSLQFGSAYKWMGWLLVQLDLMRRSLHLTNAKQPRFRTIQICRAMQTRFWKIIKMLRWLLPKNASENVRISKWYLLNTIKGIFLFVILVDELRVGAILASMTSVLACSTSSMSSPRWYASASRSTESFTF